MDVLERIPDLVDQGIHIQRKFNEAETRKYLDFLIKTVHLQCEYMTLNDITVTMYRYLSNQTNELGFRSTHPKPTKEVI